MQYKWRLKNEYLLKFLGNCVCCYQAAQSNSHTEAKMKATVTHPGRFFESRRRYAALRIHADGDEWPFH